MWMVDFTSADSEAPNSKLQHSMKLQAPSSDRIVESGFGAWVLEFLWSLEIGAWSFFQKQHGHQN